MLLEQQDVALFVGMPIAAYAGFAIVRQDGWSVGTFGIRLIPMGLVAALVAGGTALSVYLTSTTGVVAMSDEDPQAKWEYCTQWSQPPDETIEFVAPGYMGWRSGEPEGPYWGRSGRSAGWEQTHQGFMNFRLESLYIGAIPVALALFAVAAALLCCGGVVPGVRCQEAEGRSQEAGVRSQESGGRSQERVREAFVANRATVEPLNREPANLAPWRERRAEILFWGAAAVITLMLAWGKFFPLYALFYKLPVVNNIRNPAKFLQVFQLALGILAAYGLDIALRWRHMGKNSAQT
jgi:hypothetical protein